MADSRARLDQPRAARRGPRFHYDAEKFGRSTERIARFLGTGRYLVYQSVIILLWAVINVIPGAPHFDEYPFQFLTLVLSLQAAYAAPLILLAQNRQDDRDRVNLDSDRDEARESKADLEYLARELASIRMAIGEVATRDFVRSELTRLEDVSEREAREAREKAKRKAREAREARAEVKDARAEASKARAAVKETKAEIRELRQLTEPEDPQA